MKTSNKLLLGLLVVVVTGMIIVNIVLKKQYDSRQKAVIQVEEIIPADTTTVTGDSIAMDKAINNE